LGGFRVELRGLELVLHEASPAAVEFADWLLCYASSSYVDYLYARLREHYTQES